MENYIKKSYIRHKRHLRSLLPKDNKFDYGWLSNNTYDAWRHKRMYSLLDVLIKVGDSWLTVGDGRYGSDAHYLFKRGITNVMASDISPKLLKIAKQDKYIPEYKEVNAELIPFKDESCDYVLCKESFHHFSRPIIGLYEMIRVSRKGVILIEPNDTRALKNNEYENSFETVGNYKYPISIREIEKITSAISLPCIAYKGIDDIYLSNGGSLDVNSINPSVLSAKFKLLLMDFIFKLSLREKSVICLIIFKVKPKKSFIDKMLDEGFKFIVNKHNPYE
jgi:ubiquinone/menaquinone biosynthesis C-methylase UbiE